MAEELIGGFMSSNIGRGKWRGYGIYVTTDRIIGVKGGWKERLGPGLESALFAVGGAVGGPIAIGVSAALGQRVGQNLSPDDSTKAIELLDGKKDFEVRREDLEEAQIKRKKGALKRFLLNWGDLTIKTPRDTYTIKLGIQGDQGEVQTLKDMFTAFSKDKFVIKEE